MAASRQARGFTLALVGADGAGKTTLARRLVEDLGIPAAYLYMGVSKGSSNVLLPTTRLLRAFRRARGTHRDEGGPPEAAPSDAAPQRPSRRIRTGVRGLLRLANLLAEEWSRQALVALHLRRGLVVVFDRHFFADYLAHDIRGGRLPVDRRIHGWLLAHVYPRPDLVVFLDAPPEVLLARKGEGTLESLARRRAEYVSLGAHSRHFVTVDATPSRDVVAGEVLELVRGFAQDRRLGARDAGGAVLSG